MSITPLPAAPSRLTDSSDDFVEKADAFVAALPVFGTQLDALAVQVAADAADAAEDADFIVAAAAVAAAATDFLGTSVSILTMDAGSKAVVLQGPVTGLAQDDLVALIYRPDPSIRLFGSATNVADSTHITVQVGVEGIVGTGGPYANWLVISAAFFGTLATGADVRAAINDTLPVPAKAFKDALEPKPLTDAATVTPDGREGIDFTWTIGGNRTLGAITNTFVGSRGSIIITQDGAGNRVLAYASGVYKRRNGTTGLLSTPAGARDELEYCVRAVDVDGTATRVTYDIIRGV